MMKIIVLYGGKSGEHEVSLRSAASVVRNLDRSDTVLLAGIDKDGVWYLQPPEELDRVRESDSPLSIHKDPNRILTIVPGRGLFVGRELLDGDIVFPVLHGSFGEDGTVQGLLETAMVPYVGAGVLGSSLCMDKEKVKRVWNESGLPVVPSLTCYKAEFKKDPGYAAKIGREAESRFGFPLFVKPSGIGSSVGIRKINSPSEMASALENAFLYDTKVLIEQGIDAKEIECSVLGNKNPRAFTPGEVVSTHEFYDYEAKYIDPDGARLLIPADIDSDTLERVKELAVRAYGIAEVEGMARVDFFVDKNTKAIYINEINTLPGFTNISMFPRMCAFDGLAYPDLLRKLLDLGIERFEERRSLCYTYQ
jgi:D-alanine-D-alanine ligase